jgi:hypothetical protein
VTTPAGPSRARDRLEAICARIANRTPVKHACALEGVAKSSFYWLRDNDPEAELMIARAQAEASEARRIELEQVALGNVPEGVSPNANVLLHLLERSDPDNYAPPPKRVEQSGPNGHPIETRNEHAITVAPDEVMKRLKDRRSSK